jgi:phosphomannomutase
MKTSHSMLIGDLMTKSGVPFGTSGARGRVTDMTDSVCYAYTQGFLRHLIESGQTRPGTAVAIAGDLRPSTPRIMNACAAAAMDLGAIVHNCGFVPSPAVAAYGLARGIPSIMVTGSHIPDDRNGIKFNGPAGEILKDDEAAIRRQPVLLPGRDPTPPALPEVEAEAAAAFVSRYLDFFPKGALAGYRVGLYEHSSVARTLLHEILDGLGAEVTALGRSDRFVPVDTEAIRPEDIELARRWGATGRFDCLVSTDGDGDRPLLSDEGGRWLRGDLLGILCARYLDARAVVTPVSSNSALELCGWFSRTQRTRIGSPFVIAGMRQAEAEGFQPVVGYEANGGFLTASPIHRDGRTLPALPTRDAAIVLLSVMHLAREGDCGLSDLAATLPARYTASDRLKAFPAEIARARIDALREGGPAAIEAQMGHLFGKVADLDTTDGLRVRFTGGEIVHLRPSGNAPELRAYTEAESEERAAEMTHLCMALLEKWRQG